MYIFGYRRDVAVPSSCFAAPWTNAASGWWLDVASSVHLPELSHAGAAYDAADDKCTRNVIDWHNGNIGQR